MKALQIQWHDKYSGHSAQMHATSKHAKSKVIFFCSTVESFERTSMEKLLALLNEPPCIFGSPAGLEKSTRPPAPYALGGVEILTVTNL